MDTSETYIKMRIAAIPDMGMGKPPNLPLSKDGVAWVDTTVFIDRHGNYYYSKVNLLPIGSFSEACQLERQDQLQEMVEDLPYIGDSKLTWRLHTFYHFTTDEYWRLCELQLESPSMEQLWLAFVMSEKYNKIWEGDTWKAMNKDTPTRI